MSYYRAMVEWHNDGEIIEDSVIVYAENYAQAVERFSKYFGEKDIEKIAIEYFYDEAVLPIDAKVLDSLELY